MNIVQKWRKRFELSGCKIIELREHERILSNDGKIIKQIVSVKFSTPENIEIDRCIVIKNDSVVVIPIIEIDEEINFLAVLQRRVIDGNYSIEFPAGDIEDNKTPQLSAQKELFEETGINVNTNRLHLLESNTPVSESNVSEKINWFYCKLNNAELKNKNVVFGKLPEGEYIKRKILTLKDLLSLTNCHMLTACELLRREEII
tara:strand:+ start:40 stop:648 length:609 start_codon:yes stop_codon:yes gene_type:complete